MSKELPDEASSWTAREKNLWIHSEGAFHPRNYEVSSKARKIVPQNRVPFSEGKNIPPPPGSVSLILCTSEEQRANHRHLWTCFEGLDYADKELIIVETYFEQASEFWTSLHENDCRVHYIPFMQKHAKGWSLGLKRGIGVHAATAEFIAHFDEGCLYAPDYLATMVQRLREGKAGERPIAVTLSRRCVITRPTDVGVPGILEYWDPATWGPEHDHDVKSESVRRRLYGGSWTYVYRREIAIEMGFPDTTEGQDYDFYSRIMCMEGSSMVALVDDDDICLHDATPAEHKTLSCSVREVASEELAKMRVSKCGSVTKYLQSRGIKSKGMALLDTIPTAPMVIWGEPLPEKDWQRVGMARKAFNALVSSLGLAETMDASAPESNPETEGEDEEADEQRKRAQRAIRSVPEGWGILEHKSASQVSDGSAELYHSKDPRQALQKGPIMSDGGEHGFEELEYETWDYFQPLEPRKPEKNAKRIALEEESAAARRSAAAEQLAETMRADEESAKKAAEAAAKAAEDLAAAQAEVAAARAELLAAKQAKEEALKAPHQTQDEEALSEMELLKAQLEALRKENAALKKD